MLKKSILNILYEGIRQWRTRNGHSEFSFKLLHSAVFILRKKFQLRIGSNEKLLVSGGLVKNASSFTTLVERFEKLESDVYSPLAVEWLSLAFSNPSSSWHYSISSDLQS